MASKTIVPKLKDVETWTQDDFELFLRYKPKRYDFIASGAYGEVYALSKSLVLKIGRVTEDEFDRQKYFASQEAAVPIYRYSDLTHSGWFHNQLCDSHYGTATHGEECYALNEDEDEVPYGAILMRRAKPIPNKYDRKAFINFREYVESLWHEEFGTRWDTAQRHVMWYEDHFVAIDFGDWGGIGQSS